MGKDHNGIGYIGGNVALHVHYHFPSTTVNQPTIARDCLLYPGNSRVLCTFLHEEEIQLPAKYFLKNKYEVIKHPAGFELAGCFEVTGGGNV